MCGIAGYQGRFGATLIERMNTVQAHRGPDGAGSAAWRTDETVTALGHRRLAIIDLSPAGAQPMGLECPCCGSAGLDDLALTFNGEIYNYRELRQELESRGHRFSTETDSEVLLHLYGESGTALLERLNGMFAFAIRDGRPAGRPAGIEPGDVLIARDQFGVKPLYYAETGAGTVFASELKAVLQADEVERALDPMAVQLHLAYLWCPAPRTILRSVRKLEPGAAMVLRQGRVERHWFWYDLPYDGHYDTRPAAAIEEELRERLATAVRRQLVADVPVGAFLSGGVDSTAIVAMMRRAGATPQCFGIGFGSHYRGEENPDDLPYARIAARRLGVPLTEIVIGPEVVGQLERMLYFLDEPQADLAPVNAMLIGARAREAGIPVLLSGSGGDDILAGYRRHWAVRTERFWGGAPAGVRRGLARMAGRLADGTGRGMMHRPALRRAVKMFTFADLPPDDRLISYLWWSPAGVRGRLAGPLIRQSAGDVAEPLRRSLARIPAEADRLNRMLYLETKHFLPDHNLNYTDRMTMASGVEARVPFLDPDLVAFAARIPPSMKWRGRTSKAVLKRSLAGVVPEEILRRPKSGFGAPLRLWMRNELRGLVDETLSDDSVRRRGLFDPGEVRRLAERDRAGTVDGSYTLLSLMCVELWCRMFVDRRPAEVPAHV